MGTSNQRNQTVAEWLAQFGYTYNASDPLQADYNSVITADAPAGVMGAGPQEPGFGNLCEACLRARAVLYYKTSPGDCGTATPLVDPSATDLSVAASVGGSVASAAGLAIPGLGTIISLIESIFEEHAEAVQTEETTLCAVSIQATPAIKSIDAGVAAGTITPAQGIANMAQLVQTMNTGLAKIEKTPTDAAAYYVGVMNAHLSFAQIYYPLLAPAGLKGFGIKISDALSGFTSGTGLLVILGILLVAVIFLFAKFGGDL
jgi:hypothetical protein